MGLLRNGRVVGIRGLILALLLACQGTAVAQWRTQTIDFEPGWNPVYLHVQPEPRGCDAVFTNAGVDVVSWWRCGGNGTEFDTDPSDPFPREAHWLSWHADDPELSSFSSLLSGEAYMVHVQSNVPPFSLCLKGLALLNPQEWHAGELVLTGMPAGPTNPATFFDFFHYTDEIPVNFSDGGEIYRVDDEAMPQRVFEHLQRPVAGFPRVSRARHWLWRQSQSGHAADQEPGRFGADGQHPPPGVSGASRRSGSASAGWENPADVCAEQLARVDSRYLRRSA